MISIVGSKPAPGLSFLAVTSRRVYPARNIGPNKPAACRYRTGAGSGIRVRAGGRDSVPGERHGHAWCPATARSMAALNERFPERLGGDRNTRCLPLRDCAAGSTYMSFTTSRTRAVATMPNLVPAMKLAYIGLRRYRNFSRRPNMDFIGLLLQALC